MTLNAVGPGIVDLVERTLREDLGGDLSPEADITTRWTLDGETPARARILVRSRGVLAGVDIACAVFTRVDPALTLRRRGVDGDTVDVDDSVLEIAGSAAAILTGERTALNFLQQLSGVATLTRAFVDTVIGTGAQITDTRKTVPGLRVLDKVCAGGGFTGVYGGLGI